MFMFPIPTPYFVDDLQFKSLIFHCTRGIILSVHSEIKSVSQWQVFCRWYNARCNKQPSQYGFTIYILCLRIIFGSLLFPFYVRHRSLFFLHHLRTTKTFLPTPQGLPPFSFSQRDFVYCKILFTSSSNLKLTVLFFF